MIHNMSSPSSPFTTWLAGMVSLKKLNPGQVDSPFKFKLLELTIVRRFAILHG
jgi:hypothetical protein